MSKIVVAQFYTSNVTHGKFAEAINKKYCDEQGYTYYVDTEDGKIRNILEERAPTWYKPKLILEVFEKENPDYVLFLDIDAIISDFNGRIEQFIDDNYNFIAAKDISEHSVMNAGVFLIKNNEWSKQFLQDWWDLGENTKGIDFISRLPIPESELEKSGIFKHRLWHDQSILTLMYDQYEKYRNEIKIIPHHSFNHREYNDGNFIFHAYAYGHVPHRKLDIIYKEIFNTTNDENINLIIYHVYCVNNYLDIVKQQLNRLQTSGLYNWCDKLEITCVNTEGDFGDIEDLVKDLNKVNLNKYTNNSYEHEGITKVWEYSQKYSGKVLYFHTKGVSNFYTNVIDKQISERKVKGVSWWKEIMEYYLIDNYKDCLNKLDTYQQCGVAINNKWWWGNFWWADLFWIKSNNKPDNGDRWYYEAWLNQNRDPSYYEFYHFEFNAYYTNIPDTIYKNPSKYSNSEIKLISAFYGTLGEQQDEGRKIVERKGADVTIQLQENLQHHQNKGFNIRVDNQIAGDPHYGYEKMLEVHFKINEDDFIIVVNENRNFKFEL